MNPEIFILNKAKEAINAIYGVEVSDNQVQTQVTRKEFEGDITLVTFPLLKISKQAPDITATKIGEYLSSNFKEIESFNVVKGFLNIKMSQEFWHEVFNEIVLAPDFGQHSDSGNTIMIEFSSPNTNKPLHLGHVRNNLLGWSVSRILEANGDKVLRVNLVNDRGIHICKSMLAWLKMGNGETPSSSKLKGDHLVGKYYVAFSNELKKQTEELVAQGLSKEQAEKEAPILKEAQAMLVKWEQGDEQVINLWKTMNSWVYQGFEKTYDRLGISFAKTYYESQTYLLGKALVKEGLKKGIFETHSDGSVWCDLTEDGLDKKLLLRGDGTSVYMTQDLGTAHQRYSEYKLDEHIYVVGNEQNYHFQVLKLVLKKLGFSWSDSIYHLSYGMVELPEGKMKSREGTVVDADDLLENMYETAKETSMALGRLDDMPIDQQEALFEMIGLGALKYFILKVDPKKTMLFDPKESIDFNGNTGPFIQYTHARIKSIIRKSSEQEKCKLEKQVVDLLPKEIEIIKLLNLFPDKISEAAKEHSPAIIANYCYDIAKEFSQYYHDVSILKEENLAIRAQRLVMIDAIAKVLCKGMDMLGIKLPSRM